MNDMIEVPDGHTADGRGTWFEPDVIVMDDYSMIIFFPHTLVGEMWLAEHLPDDCPVIGSGWAVESNYAGDIITGMMDDGIHLKLKMGARQ